MHLLKPTYSILWVCVNTSQIRSAEVFSMGGMGTGFALIVVLFILLIIVGASFVGGGY